MKNDIFEKYGDEPSILDAIDHAKQVRANKVWKTLGASNHVEEERQAEDFYETDPSAVNRLMQASNIYHPGKDALIWECAVGRGALAHKLEEFGYTVVGSDLIDRSNGEYPVSDFFKTDRGADEGKLCILTNPPYSMATDFILHSMKMLKPGEKCYMLLKTLFLEGQTRRKKIFDNPGISLDYVLQFSKRINCYKDGIKTENGGAQSYAWYIFRKVGENEPKRMPQIDWI